MTDLVPITELLDVHTGEVLPATVENAARALIAARDMKHKLNGVVTTATAYLVDEAQRQGKKTLPAFHEDFGQPFATITLNGGTSIEYDAHDLMQLLREAGCPETRIEEAVVAEVTYKVNRSVLRQLAGANEDYKATIEHAAREVEKPWRASVK